MYKKKCAQEKIQREGNTPPGSNYSIQWNFYIYIFQQITAMQQTHSDNAIIFQCFYPLISTHSCPPQLNILYSNKFFRKYSAILKVTANNQKFT